MIQRLKDKNPDEFVKGGDIKLQPIEPTPVTVQPVMSVSKIREIKTFPLKLSGDFHLEIKKAVLQLSEEQNKTINIHDYIIEAITEKNAKIFK